LQCGLFRSNFALPIVISVDPERDLLRCSPKSQGA
jgi:hypothetical protein